MSGAGWGRGKARKSLPWAIHPKVTSDPSPTQWCASPGHRHRADRCGLAWASRRPLYCHSFLTHDPSAPGSPARRSGLSRGSLHPEKRNFISTPSPSRRTLPPPRAAAESTGCVTSPLGLARNPARAAGIPRGDGCSGPARPAHLRPGAGASVQGRGRGGSHRSPSATPRGNWYPAPAPDSPTVWARGHPLPLSPSDKVETSAFCVFKAFQCPL